MITWFQRVFGKHFKWVLIAFLGVLFFSFVVSIGAVPRLSMQNNGQGKANLFLGVNLNDQQEMSNLANAVQYTYRSLYGLQISSPQELEQLVYYRIVMMHLADEWQLPAANAQQMEDFLKSLRVFRNADGHFSPEFYQKYRDSVETSPQRDTITALLKEECRIERVRNLLGGPGYAIPFVAEAQVALGNIKSDVDVATVDYKSFTPKIEATGDKLTTVLKAIYDKDPTRFPVPAQVNLSYVKFPFAAVAEPTLAQMQDFAKQHKDTLPNINPDNLTDKDKTTITEAWRKDQTRIQTLKFARELYDIKTQLGSQPLKPDAPAVAALLKKYNLTLQKLPTITVGTPVAADSPIADDIAQEAAMALSAEQPTRPALLSDATVVFFYVSSTPSRPSAFEEARADVLKAYTDMEKQRQFTELCKTQREAVVKDVAAGKTFAEAAKAHGFAVKNYPAVTLEDIQKTLNDMPFSDTEKSDVPPGPLAAMGRDALTALFSSNNSTVPMIMALHTGEVSPLLAEGNTGVIFIVAKREAATVTADSPEIKKVAQGLAERENLIASMTVLGQLTQTFRQAAAK